MSESRSRLAISTSILTLIGIIVLTINEQIGLTIVFLSILLLAGYFIRNRLERVGIESFALGSVFVWFGFFTMAFPVIAYAWNIIATNLQIVFFVIGIFLILFGFTFEIYDLNAKFVKLLRNLKNNLDDAWIVIREKLLRSIWTFFAIIFTLLGILSIFVPFFQDNVPNLFGFTFGVALEFIILAFLSLAIEFRSAIIVVVKSLGQFLNLLVIALVIRIRRLPKLISDFYNFIKRIVIRIANVIFDVSQFLINNLFVTGFLSSLIFGLIGIIQRDQTVQAIAIILLLISLINVLNAQRDIIANRVAGIQQSAYRRSFTLRNIIRSEHTGNCPSCNQLVTPGRKHCQNCGNFIPACLVCRNTVFAGEQILTCKTCEYIGHADHLERWLNMRPTCPNCRSEWK